MNDISSSRFNFPLNPTRLLSFRIVRIAAAAAVLVLATPANASSGSCKVTVKNCGSGKIVVRAYDGDDAVRIIAADDTILGVNHSDTLSCTGNACDIAAEVFGTSGASGYRQSDCDSTVYITTIITYKVIQSGSVDSVEFDLSGSGC